MINNIINLILMLNYDLKEGFYRATDKNTNNLIVLFVSCLPQLNSLILLEWNLNLVEIIYFHAKL